MIFWPIPPFCYGRPHLLSSEISAVLCNLLHFGHTAYVFAFFSICNNFFALWDEEGKLWNLFGSVSFNTWPKNWIKEFIATSDKRNLDWYLYIHNNIQDSENSVLELRYAKLPLSSKLSQSGAVNHRFKDGVSVKYHIPDICMIWYTMWPDMPMICNTDVSLMFGRNSYSSAKYHYNKYH